VAVGFVYEHLQAVERKKGERKEGRRGKGIEEKGTGSEVKGRQGTR